MLWIVVPGALGLQGAVELGQPGDHLNAVTEIGIAAMVIVALAVGILFATLTFDTVRSALRRSATCPHRPARLSGAPGRGAVPGGRAAWWGSDRCARLDDVLEALLRPGQDGDVCQWIAVDDEGRSAHSPPATHADLLRQDAANITALTTEENLRAIRATAEAIGSARRTVVIGSGSGGRPRPRPRPPRHHHGPRHPARPWLRHHPGRPGHPAAGGRLP